MNLGEVTKCLCHMEPMLARVCLLGFAPHLNVNVQSLKIDKDGQFIVANITISGEPFTVIAVYLPPNHRVTQKLDTLNTLMSEIAQSQNTRVIWCGDFNMVLE